MAITGEKSASQKGFINITEVELEDRSAPLCDTEERPSQPTQSLVNDLADKWWLWEVVAWSTSLIGLIGVFVLLWSVKEKEVPDWKWKTNINKPVEFKLTINSVISILATLVRSSLFVPLAAAFGQQKWLWFQGGAQRLSDFQQFDAANRGPLGSLILIWSLRGRRLACLGAFIVIASLGLDFSFQSMVTYPTETRGRVGKALMPVANAVDGYDLVKSYAGGSRKMIATIHPSMLSAVYAGIFANGIADQLSVSPDCDSGNCTWTKTYATLGVCGKCYDITSSIHEECASSPATSNDESITYDNICTYSIPHGLEIRSNELVGTRLSIQGLDSANTTKNTIHFRGLRSPLAVMYLLNMTRPYGGPVYPNSSFAAECALEYCVKKYSGSVSLGKLTENLIDTFFNESADFDQEVGLNVNGSPEKASYLTIEPPSPWLFNISNSDSSFTVGASAHSDLQQIFMTSDVCSTGGAFDAEPGCPLTIFDGNVSADLSGGRVTTLGDIPRRIYSLNFTGLETMMQNVAHGLTTSMRNSKSTYFPGSNAPLKGQVTRNVVIAHVRWGWFAVPTTLLVLTLVFMLLTAWETQQRKAMLWKGSSLPAFYYPLTREGRSRMTNVASPRQMENTANAMKVKWQMTESGMRLVKAD